ncbi:uncharacterized protein ABDE67_013986 [Symphorus nematophorus]
MTPHRKPVADITEAMSSTVSVCHHLWRDSDAGCLTISSHYHSPTPSIRLSLQLDKPASNQLRSPSQSRDLKIAFSHFRGAAETKAGKEEEERRLWRRAERDRSEWSGVREGEVTCGCEEQEEEDGGFLRHCIRHPQIRFEKGEEKRLSSKYLTVKAAGRPVSELYPLGGAVSLESTLSAQSIFDTSNSSTQAASPSRRAGGAGHTCQEEPKEAVSEVCKEHSAAPPTGESNCSVRVSGDPGEQKHCAPSQASSHPHSLVEVHTTSHHHKMVVNAVSDEAQAGRMVQSLQPASLPVYRSHSGTLPLTPPAPDSQTCGHGGEKSVQEAESHSMLACKQPMQLQQCNIITTICRGATSGEGGVQQAPTRCVCVSSPKAAAKVEAAEKKDHLPLKCDSALCYGSYIHHANFEDTFAAYCHPQPIPAPSQVLPRQVESSCDVQRGAVPPLAMNHLTLPRLISSVSETGLDAKHLLRCCNLNCPWMNTLPRGLGLEECCSSSISHVRTTTRDMATMTAHKELRDVGVQVGTGQSVTPHVFPQICLAEESRSETSCSQTSNTDTDGSKKAGGAPKSPVKEVKWDAEGMTWEVYGASVDPEELGLAIQRHLELQIKETANHAAKLARQDTNTSRRSGSNGCQRKRSRMMSSIRPPACCARTTTAVD